MIAQRFHKVKRQIGGKMCEKRRLTKESQEPIMSHIEGKGVLESDLPDAFFLFIFYAEE